MAKILAAIDASAYATSVCDHVAWLARRTQGSVQVLHVIPRDEGDKPHLDLSGSIGLGARSHLLEDLVKVDEANSRIAREQGRAMLEGAEQRLRDAGVRDVTTLHRHGEVTESIVELEPNVDLVVIGKRGETGKYAPGHLGAKVERVVRSSVKPVLVVPRIFMEITRAVVAFDGGASSTKALRLVAQDSTFAGLDCNVVIVCGNPTEAQRRNDLACEILNGHPSANVTVLSGDVEGQIKAQLRHGAGDLLVMGAYGHSRIRELIIGSTTTALLRTVKVPLLMFR